jgi:ectoine hydroxylase-related dioxygenase (phytanoyl-CoA dioxygenase family)
MNSEFRIQNSEEIGFSRFEQDGFQIINSLVSENECHRLAVELTPLFEQQIKSSKNRIGGIRNLLRTNSFVSNFSKSPAVLGLLGQATGKRVFPVRAIFFDKNPDANWLVPWHQDLAIAVKKQIETNGFTGWSVKNGTLHVHPPEEILAGMIALRLHLDDCAADNGALKVITGSHLAGKISSSEIPRWADKRDQIICEVRRGGALLMRPLLLHASSPAETPKHRRVLHIEYASQKLPNGLEWFDN